MLYSEDQFRHATAYVADRGKRLSQFLGAGTDGAVWKVENEGRITVAKVFEFERQYRTEIGCYQRLSEHGVTEILGLRVPRLVDHSEALMAVEISFVSPPYLIDFGKAYLDDASPEHSSETLAEYEAMLRDRWGERFGDVQAILWKLRQIGIDYRDPNRDNIIFRDG